MEGSRSGRHNECGGHREPCAASRGTTGTPADVIRHPGVFRFGTSLGSGFFVIRPKPNRQSFFSLFSFTFSRNERKWPPFSRYTTRAGARRRCARISRERFLEHRRELLATGTFFSGLPVPSRTRPGCRKSMSDDFKFHPPNLGAKLRKNGPPRATRSAARALAARGGNGGGSGGGRSSPPTRRGCGRPLPPAPRPPFTAHTPLGSG